MEISKLESLCREIRRDIINMLTEAGSGHPGGSLSSVELLVSLYFSQMKYNVKDPNDPDRDYFILSKGHGCPTQYAILAKLGMYDRQEMSTLRRFGSRLQGHPGCVGGVPGVEVSTGSLGYGLSIGVGAAIGAKKAAKTNRVYVLMGDGEQQEGSIWEAAMAAGHFKLDNLCAMVDYNRLQIDGPVDEVMGVAPLGDKYRAFLWNVIEIDGHNLVEVEKAYAEAKKTKGKPTLILAKTVKGKGVSFMENICDWHGKAPSKEQAQKALKELE